MKSLIASLSWGIFIGLTGSQIGLRLGAILAAAVIGSILLTHILKD